LSRLREKNFGEASKGDLASKLEDYVREIAKAFKPEAIILYGSRARGDFKPSSDYDVIVISGRLPAYEERWNQLCKYRSRIPLEPRGFTPKEFLEIIERCSPTALDSLYEGKILYGTNS
jgi:hypothetical protein